MNRIFHIWLYLCSCRQAIIHDTFTRSLYPWFTNQNTCPVELHHYWQNLGSFACQPGTLTRQAIIMCPTIPGYGFQPSAVGSRGKMSSLQQSWLSYKLLVLHQLGLPAAQKWASLSGWKQDCILTSWSAPTAHFCSALLARSFCANRINLQYKLYSI